MGQGNVIAQSVVNRRIRCRGRSRRMMSLRRFFPTLFGCWFLLWLQLDVLVLTIRYLNIIIIIIRILVWPK